MKKTPLYFLSLFVLAAGVYAQAPDSGVGRPQASAAVAPAGSEMRTAIFISNRAGEKFDKDVLPLEDFVTSKVVGKGFEIISREVAVDSLRNFDPATASAKRPADSLDAKLTEQSSALRLSQNLGANYILVASITSVGNKERAVNSYGVNMVTNETILRVTYKIIDGSNGGTLISDNFKVSDSLRQTENAAEKNSDLLSDLLEQAASQLAENLDTKVREKGLRAVSLAANLVNMTINVEVADLTIPDIRLGTDNTVNVYTGQGRVSPVSATVEVDGVAVGTAPGTLHLRPGFSKIRVVREGFKPWERTINAVNGQSLSVALQMTDEALARWKQSTAFLNDLQNGAKLTDGQVEVLKGQAKALSESGYKVNMKVDTKDAPTFINKSIF